MQTENFIPGKDASHESSIATMLAKLEKLDFHVESAPGSTPRVGELKTILALAVGDDAAIREGCEWVHHFEQIDPARRLVYRCIDTLLELGSADGHRSALEHLYGRAPLATAEAMLRGEQRCFGIEVPGLALKGCDLHQSLLAAYAKRSH